MIDPASLSSHVEQLQMGGESARQIAAIYAKQAPPMTASDAEKTALRDALIACLQDDDVQVRRLAVMALGRINDAASQSAIAQQLRDSVPAVRRRVCAHLLKHPHEAALVVPLLAVLQDDSVDYAGRDFAAMTLASGNHRQAIPTIINMLETGPAAIYRRMVHCIIRMPHADALPVLQRISTDETVDDTTRKVAKRAIGVVQVNEYLADSAHSASEIKEVDDDA